MSRDFLTQMIEFDLELEVPDEFQDLNFYQVYAEVSTDSQPDYYESFQFTLKYELAKNGAIDENNAWIYSFCDQRSLSELADTGNFQEAIL
mmetsp:Transcript_28527/g.38049  ORF Transcript_28527/g.38049 Transcript_28527/m.38049 type:complete len:91 (+) Transcript_28527:119-391(+)